MHPVKLTRAAGLVFLVLALAYAYFYMEPGSNGNTRLALTMAMVKDGTLNIDKYIASGYTTGDLALYQGKYYIDKAIGSSVLGAAAYYPIYNVLGWFGVTLVMAQEKHLLTLLVIGLPAAVAGTLMFMVGEYLSKSRFRAFVATLAVGLGTMYFPFSAIYFGHVLAASLLFGAFFIIFLIKIQPLRTRTLYLCTFLAGLLLGLAFLTDMTTAVVILPLAAYYFYVLWTRKLLRRALAWVFPALGGLAPILLMVAYNLQVYGVPFVTGYEYLWNPAFKEGMAQGIMGIGLPKLPVLFYETFHPAQGLFWQSPVLIMALVGGFFMLRQKQFRAELAVAAFACVAYLLLNAGYYMWWGGHSFAPRNILPMLPFLSLPLVFVPRKAFPAVILLTVVSVAQMGIVAASGTGVTDDNYMELSSKGFFEYSSIYNYCLQKLIAGQFTWNMGSDFFGLKGWASLLPLSIVVSGASLGMAFFSARSGQNPGSNVEKFAPRDQ